MFCLYVGDNGEPCKYDWTNRDAILGAHSCGPKETCNMTGLQTGEHDRIIWAAWAIQCELLQQLLQQFVNWINVVHKQDKVLQTSSSSSSTFINWLLLNFTFTRSTFLPLASISLFTTARAPRPAFSAPAAVTSVPLRRTRATYRWPIITQHVTTVCRSVPSHTTQPTESCSNFMLSTVCLECSNAMINPLKWRHGISTKLCRAWLVLEWWQSLGGQTTSIFQPHFQTLIPGKVYTAYSTHSRSAGHVYWKFTAG